MKSKNIIIITGASAGIGLEFALQIDTAFTNIDEIWLVARRKERLMELAKVMVHKTKLICMDVTDEYALDLFESLLEEANVTVRMLINAAGFGLLGSFEDIPLEEQLDMVELNCKALTKMTYITLPYMKKESRIIQMSSTAAFLPQPDFAVYAATKSYVLSFSRALNKELAKYKIYVTAVCPGPVDTEFFTIAEQYGRTLAIKKLTMITTRQCVDSAIKASYKKQDIAVPGIPMKAFLLATKILPQEIILRFSTKLKA